MTLAFALGIEVVSRLRLFLCWIAVLVVCSFVFQFYHYSPLDHFVPRHAVAGSSLVCTTHRRLIDEACGCIALAHVADTQLLTQPICSKFPIVFFLLLQAAFHKTVETFGGIDILCNNAGIMNEVSWELSVSVNLVSVDSARMTWFHLRLMTPSLLINYMNE